MPPKRQNTGSPVTRSPSKKVKHDTASPQKKLDTFFKKPNLVKPETEPSSSKSQSNSGGPSRITDTHLALEMAAADGMDLETTAKLERMFKADLTTRNQTASLEIIDVDELDPSLPQIFRDNTGAEPMTSQSGRADSSSSNQRTTPMPVIGHNHVGEAASDRHLVDLAVDPVVFSCETCPWSEKAAPYSFLAHALASLTDTKSRISIINILTNTLRMLIVYHSPSLLPALYLLSNTLSPPYISVEMGLGSSIISKAIKQVSGLTPAALKRLYNRTGDPGDVAFEAKSNLRTLVPHPPLTIIGVYEALLKISRSRGDGSTKQKQSIVEKLIVSAKGEETRYIVRTLCQNLRVGAVRTSILIALARSMVLSKTKQQSGSGDSPFSVPSQLLEELAQVPSNSKKKSAPDLARLRLNEIYAAAEALVKKVYAKHPNYDHIVAALLEGGLDGLLDRVALSVGTPLLNTLGSPMRSLDEVYDRLGTLAFTAEFKYDGQRAQIHASRDLNGAIAIKIFSRHLEDMTDKYPDIIHLVEAIFEEQANTQSFIIDSEIVAIDPSDGSIKSFQELSGRARKDVQLHEVKVAVCVFVFDLMYYNGMVLLEETFRSRRERLRIAFPPLIPDVKGAARLAHVECCESEEGREAVEQFWKKAVDSRSEGLMIKLLDSGEILENPDDVKGKSRRKPLPATYEPDKRTSAWLKLKKDYVTGLTDSLDLIPIGAWHGNGRKAQWWSPILLAIWDKRVGRPVAVCKCMSGFTDEFYKLLRDRYAEDTDNCSRSSLWECDVGGLRPEVYFRPHEVWEIRGADITLSPVSVAAKGLVSDSRGLSLRFPRFIRIRDDKRLDDASSGDFLADMWRSQQGKGKEAAGGVDEFELLDVSENGSDVAMEEEDSD